ncbi:hypothetical protein EMPG_12097 [Blastomyces silverae]|uniref:Diphthamide biosynthesis protein 4 n=1 Tax=Blastomyces silverae TaxID=2060906 RepID=A0A0H1BNM2_9EURO|nr:hypothetical protein EMPG_12097 [Blastomyces silverae]
MTALSTTALGISTTTTHYSILNIPYPPPHRLLKPDVKLAYHRALLKHHPDKSRTASSNPAKTPTTSIAFRTNGASTGTNSNSRYTTNRETTSTSSITTEASNPAGTAKVSPPPPHAPQLSYTIDQITTAYKVLSDPVARAEYDRSLRLLGINGNRHGHGHGHGDDEGTPFRTGMEVFDLDDMQMARAAFGSDSGTNSDNNGSGGTWYHSCRCGEEKGFVVLEEELEREAERGEVVVGCRGCSLWAKVVFAVDEGGEEEMENDRIS